MELYFAQFWRSGSPRPMQEHGCILVRAVFLVNRWHLLIVLSCAGKAGELCGVPFMSIPLSRHNHLSMTPPSNIIALEMTSTYKFRGKRRGHKHSAAKIKYHHRWGDLLQLYLTHFWKLEVQGQGVGRFVFPRPLSLACRWLPSVFLHALFFMHTCLWCLFLFL